MPFTSDINVRVSEQLAAELLNHAGFVVDDDGCWVRPHDAGKRTPETGQAITWILEDIAAESRAS